MDRLSKHHAEIVCFDKIVSIPLVTGGTLIIQGETGRPSLNIISCMKTRRYLRKGYQVIIAHVTKNKSEEKRLEDVPMVRDFPEVFPEDLFGLPPPRQTEFQIDLVPGVAPMARAPYILAFPSYRSYPPNYGNSWTRNSFDRVLRLGGSGPIREKERRIFPNVYRLPRAEQNNR